jgi:hypothetical protein
VRRIAGVPCRRGPFSTITVTLCFGTVEATLARRAAIAARIANSPLRPISVARRSRFEV